MTMITVVETLEFERCACAVMSEDERLNLVDSIARNPTMGDSIGGGIRKVRIARAGGGKSGGYRVIYFYGHDDDLPIFLIAAFAKNKKANLTKTEERKVIALGKQLADRYRGSK